MKKLSWRQVAYWNNERLWSENDLVTYVETAWNLGYRYALWYDGDVYTMIQDTNNQWIVDRSEYTQEDIQ